MLKTQIIFNYTTFRDFCVLYCTMSDSNFRKFLLGTVPTDDDKEIKGSKLPTKRQVLLCYLDHRQCSTTISKRDASKKKTVDCVIPFFQKAGVPTLSKQKMAEAVEKL